MPRRQHPFDDIRRPEWAKWLVAQREARGWLQREFAEHINVSQQSLSGYERGIYRVPEDVAEQIASALNLPYVEVRSRLGMYVPEEDRPGDEGEVIYYQLPAGVRLTGKQRKALLALIEAFVESQSPDGDPEIDVSFDEDVEIELRHAASDR